MLGGVTANVDHSRIGINREKRNPEDFALWKFADETTLGFNAPFGNGFPGWHLECSAMSMKYLGDQFDVHTGGIDHISIHHNNEIAQSKALTGKLLARYWVHNNHITITGEKMAKSGENFLSLHYMQTQGISSMGVRMWYLQSRYSTRVDYSLDALIASETAWQKIKDHFLTLGQDIGKVDLEYAEKFYHAVNDDLDTPKALTYLWELQKDSKIINSDKKATMLEFDKVFGFNLISATRDEIDLPLEVKALLQERKEAREAKNFIKSDHLRKILEEQGFEVKDVGEEQIVSKSNIR
jgi:cysteinyl-tRNA synthetase